MGRNQLRDWDVPGGRPGDVEALTACIDWVIGDADDVAGEDPPRRRSPTRSLLQEQVDVELGLDWDGDELEKRIGEFDGS